MAVKRGDASPCEPELGTRNSSSQRVQQEVFPEPVQVELASWHLEGLGRKKKSSSVQLA